MDLYIGLMSGTSMDGIDAVLVGFENQKLELKGYYNLDFAPDLKQDLHTLIGNYQIHLKKLGEIDHRLGLTYAKAVNGLLDKYKISSGQIKAIGCHGQTIYHSPSGKYPFTMQIGDANLVAAQTGIITINDLRRMDMAAGGEGAPLVPAFHQAYFNHPNEKRTILNLGGIANISILNPHGDQVIGFDTGPANCLIDEYIYSQKKLSYDKNGNWAKNGRIINNLLDQMLATAYFNLPAPKSTGREQFNLKWVEQFISENHHYSPVDIQATLTELTAQSVSRAIKTYQPEVSEIYACGGGAFNSYLLERIAINFPNAKVLTTQELGIHPQLVEATAFAWLAKQRLEENPGNLPSVTGAHNKVILGAIYAPKQW